MFQIYLICLVLDLSRFCFSRTLFFYSNKQVLSGEEDGYPYSKHAEAASAEEEHRGRTEGGFLLVID